MHIAGIFRFFKNFLNTFIAYANEKNLSNYPIHFKINSGLNRIGFKEDEIEKAFKLMLNSNRFFVQSIYSHLSASEDLNEKVFTPVSYTHLTLPTISDV